MELDGTTRASAARSLRAIRLIHTVAWAFFAACIVAIPLLAWSGRLAAAGLLIGVVFVEVVVLVVNGGRCPLTDVAARHTDDRRDNFDIHLPLWLARHNKTIFGFLYLFGIVVTVAKSGLAGIAATALSVWSGAAPPEFPAFPPARVAQLRAIEARLAADPCASPYPVRAGGLVRPPVPLDPYDPAAIREAYARRDLVFVELVIGVDGVVRDAAVLEAPSREAGLKAVAIAERWRFAPATCRGRAVPVLWSVLVPWRDPA